MAKSAKSKGYRKQQQKKPWLTKKEAIAGIIILVVFIAIFVFVTNDDLLFYIFPDGYMAGRDVQEGDIVAHASKDVKTRYLKIGEMGELEGFTLTTTRNNKNVPYSYTFNPDDETNNVVVTVTGSAETASTMPGDYQDTIAGLGATITFTDTVETTIQGRPAYIFSYINDYYDSSRDPEAVAEESGETAEGSGEAAEGSGEAAEESGETAEESGETAEESGETEQPSNVFQQNCTAYIDIDGSHTLCLHVNQTFEDDQHYLSEDQIVDFVMSYTNCFTVIAPEAEK